MTTDYIVTTNRQSRGEHRLNLITWMALNSSHARWGQQPHLELQAIRERGARIWPHSVLDSKSSGGGFSRPLQRGFVPTSGTPSFVFKAPSSWGPINGEGASQFFLFVLPGVFICCDFSKLRFLSLLVSHYSAIGDTIWCDAPCSSAIGFRTSFFWDTLLPRPVFGLR